jgi:hypothetical protein
VVAAGQRGRVRRRLAGAHAGQDVVHPLEHLARPDLVGDAGDAVDLLVVDRGRDVDRDEVAVAHLALDRHQGAEALAEVLQLGVDLLVAHLQVVDRDLETVQLRELDLGPDVDLGGELELALRVGVGHVGHVDLRLAQRAHLLGLDGLEVEARQGVVDGLLDHDAAAEPLVDDARRHLALAEPGDGDLLGDRLVRRVETGLELVVRDLDGELHPGRVEGLDGALHSGLSWDIRGRLRGRRGGWSRALVAGRCRSSWGVARRPDACGCAGAVDRPAG